MEKREQKPESKKDVKPLKKRKRKPVGKKVIEQEKEKREYEPWVNNDRTTLEHFNSMNDIL